jgi:hypothetical protein
LFLKIPPVRKFLSLPVHERQLVFRVFLILGLIRLGMWVLPFRVLQRSLQQFFPCPTNTILSPAQKLSANHVSLAVKSVSRYVPSATCLAQALAVQSLLSRGGIHSDLVLGVARDDASRIAAHAWVEIEGIVIIGGLETDRYTRLKKVE